MESRFATINAAWSSGVIGSDDRIRMNDGLLSRRKASSVAKSVSCEMTIRSSDLRDRGSRRQWRRRVRLRGRRLCRVRSISTTRPLGATCWRRRGTSRETSERQLAFLHCLSGVFQRRCDVGGFEVGEVGKNLVSRSSGGELSDHGSDRDSQPSNTGRSAHLGWIDRDSFEAHVVMIRGASALAVRRRG